MTLSTKEIICIAKIKAQFQLKSIGAPNHTGPETNLHLQFEFLIRQHSILFFEFRDAVSRSSLHTWARALTRLKMHG